MKQYNVQIVKEGRYCVVYLPLNSKEDLFKLHSTPYVCGLINCVPFRNKLLSKGNGVYFMMVDKKTQKALGNIDNSDMNYTLQIEEDSISSPKIENENTLDNEVLQNIRTRISVRRYTNQDVSDEEIKTILNAGFEAPSAHNTRPWHFVVVKDKNTLDLLASKGSTHKKLLSNANVAIVVCGDVALQGTKELLINDISAATENMLLAINSLNLGGVWLGMTFNQEYTKEVIQILNLPMKVIPLAIIALGHPNESRAPKERFDTNKVHYEKW